MENNYGDINTQLQGFYFEEDDLHLSSEDLDHFSFQIEEM